MHRRSVLVALSVLALGSVSMSGCGEDSEAIAGPDDLGEDLDDEPTIAPSQSGDVVILPYVSIHDFGSKNRPIWTGLQVANAAHNGEVAVEVQLLNLDGSVFETLGGSVVAGSSTTFIPHDEIDLAERGLDGWTGAARVYSKQPGVPLRVVTNLASGLGWDANAGGSYEGTALPRKEWTLPYLDVDPQADTLVAVHNAGGERSRVELALTDGSSKIVFVDPGETRHLWMNAVAAAGVSVGGGPDGNPQRNVAAGVLTSQHPVSVAVINAQDRTMTAYTPPQMAASEAPLVNFQPGLGFDTWLYALNDGVPGEMSVEYRMGARTCVERIEGVAAHELVDFGWSFTRRRHGSTLSGTQRHSTCTDLGTDGTFIGTAKLDPGSVGVVIQQNALHNESAYATGSAEQSAGNKLLLPLLQVNNGESNNGDHGWWSGYSLSNTSDHQVAVRCTYFESDPAQGAIPAHDDFIIPKNESRIRVLYEKFGNDYFVGSAICEVQGNGEISATVNQQSGWDGPTFTYRAAPVGSPKVSPYSDGVCGVVREILPLTEDTRQAGLVLGVEQQVSRFGAVGVIGKDFVWDVGHNELAVHSYVGAGVTSSIAGAQTGLTGYAGVALNFEDGVSNWQGWFVTAAASVGIDLEIPFITEAEASVGVSAFVSAEDLNNDGFVDPITENIFPQGVYGAAATASISASVGIVPDPFLFGDASIGASVGLWKLDRQATRDLYERHLAFSFAGFQLVEAHLVDQATGADCLAADPDWPGNDPWGDDVADCIISLGDPGSGTIKRAAHTAASICATTHGCSVPFAWSMATAALVMGAVNESGQSLGEYCAE